MTRYSQGWRRTGLPAVILGLTFLPPGYTPPAPPRAVPRSAALAFNGVTVIDVTNGERHLDQTVVIVGNRIQSIGPAQSASMPAGTLVVDARGKYLIPGLWEMHTHAWYLEDPALLPSFILHGVTGVRQAAGQPPSPQRQMLQEIVAGTLVGPPRQIFSTSPVGLESLAPWAATDSAKVREIVKSAKADGYDMVKTNGDDKQMYLFLAAEARRAGLRIGGHIVDALGPSALEASDSGVSIVDHIGPSSGGLDRLCVRNARPRYQTATLETCRQAAERLRRNGTWWVVTMSESLTMRGSDLLPNARSQRIMGACHTDQGNWLRDAARFAPPGSPGFGAPPDSSDVLNFASRVGMPILAGTDFPPTFGIHAELAFLVSEGLTPLAALQAATLNPALWLHATDSLGTVAAGKLADLVLLDADPLVDITNTTTLRAVVANGRYYDRAALEEIAAALPDGSC